MNKIQSEKGFILTILLVCLALVVGILIAMSTIFQRFIPNPSLAWESDFKAKCEKELVQRKVNETVEREDCYPKYRIYDAGDKLIALDPKKNYSYLFALSKETGKLIWQTSLASHAYNQRSSIYENESKDSIEFWNDKIYLFGLSKITALDSSTGDKVNEAILPFKFGSDPILAGDKFLVVSEDGKLYEIDTETLSSSFKSDLPYWNKYILKTNVEGNTLYYIGKYHQNDDSKFIAYDFVNNKIIWAVDSYPKDLADIPMDEKYLYFLDYDDRILALNKETGEVVWSVDVEHVNPDFLQFSAISKDKVAVSTNNKIYVIDKDSGKIVNLFTNDGEVSVGLKISNDIFYTFYNNRDHSFGGSTKSWIVAQNINTGEKLAEYQKGRDGLDSVFSDQVVGDKYYYVVCRRSVCAFKKPLDSESSSE